MENLHADKLAGVEVVTSVVIVSQIKCDLIN